MSKIFEWDVRKGTFIDSVQKNIGTATVFDFKKGSKGVFNHFLASGDFIVNFTNDSKYELDDKVSFVVAFRTSYNYTDTYPSGIIKKMNSTSPYNGFEFGIRENKISMHTGGSYANNALYGNKTINDGQWHLAIGTFNVDYSYIYVDNELDVKDSRGSLLDSSGYPLIIGSNYNLSRNFAGDILYIKVYNNILSAQERNDLYQEFLNSTPTEKPIRGFELVKPTDLSYLKDTGLVAAYNMIPNGNTLVDISGNGRNGTLNGGLINTKDGLGFNGTNGYIGSLTSPTYTDKLSVSVRFKPTDDTFVGYKGIVGDWNLTSDKRSWFITKETGAGNKYEFDISTTGLWVSGRSIATNTALTKNQVYTLTAVYDGAKIYMYLNGVKQTAERNVTGNLFQGDLLQIGTYDNNLTRCFTGEIHDIRIYNRVLTEQEIKDYHNSFIKPVILEDWSGSAVGDTI